MNLGRKPLRNDLIDLSNIFPSSILLAQYLDCVGYLNTMSRHQKREEWFQRMPPLVDDSENHLYLLKGHSLVLII